MTLRRSLSLSLLALAAGPLLGLAAGPATAGVEVGHVVAVEGRATASLGGEPARVLACGDPVHADERLATAVGARLVVAREGRHLHLGPDALAVLRVASDGATRLALIRGAARLLDTGEAPVARLATSAGALDLGTEDVELRRLGAALRVCEWSAGTGVCRRIEPSGRVRRVVREGPELDLGVRDLCEWSWRDAPPWIDFAATPPVAAGPAVPAFEPELELDPLGEPGCAGDECTGLPPADLPDPEIEYTVATPPLVDPLAGL